MNIFILSSEGQFASVDGTPFGDGDTYSLNFALEFGEPTTSGIPWSITSLGFEVGEMPFEVSPVSSEGADMGILSPGTYFAGTELFEPRVEIFSPGTTTSLGSADFAFYFRDESVPVELSTAWMGDDVLQQGVIVDFQTTWTTQVLGYGQATGVSDVAVVPEPGVSLLLMLALGFSLWRRSR